MFKVGDCVKLRKSIRIEMPALYLDISAGAELTVVDSSWYENSHLPNHRKIYMVALQSDAFTTPYQFTAQGSQLIGENHGAV